MHSRVTIFSTSLTTTNPRRELKAMHQMQWQEHTKCSSPPLSNPTKATKSMEEYERKNKENTNYGEALVQKNRNGAVGTAKLTFIKDQLRFESYFPEQPAGGT